MSGSPAPIAASEYEARQDALRNLARAQGFDAVLAWSRGGGSQDHSADVLYLTGFYPNQPFVPDLRGSQGWRWRAGGHAAVLVETDGPVTLIVDSEKRQDPAPVASTLVVSADPVETLAGLVASARTGLVGGEALGARWARVLDQRFELVEADELSWRLRLRKSPAEREWLRVAGALGARGMDAALATAVPGVTEAQVAAAAVAEVTAGGGAVFDVVLSSGRWANTLAPSGGPAGAAGYSQRTLEPGDLLRIDAYGSLGGYFFDLARSRVVGRPPSDEQQALLEAVKDSVCAGASALRPGATLGEAARACEQSLSVSGYAREHGTPASTMGGAWGHGLGLGFEPPWVDPDSEVMIEEGLCLALERRIEAGALGGAQYEDDFLIGAEGPELLTPAP